MRHRHRINRVVNHIRDNLTERLDVDMMADMAYLSKYHFIKIFDKYMGETPHQYSARLRLEQAARHIWQNNDKNITQIALDCGFSGSDIFSRAFKNQFGNSPKHFRNRAKAGFAPIDEHTSFADQLLVPTIYAPVDELFKLTPRIEYRAQYHIAYIRHIGSYFDINLSITKTHWRLCEWAKMRGVSMDKAQFIGRCGDNCEFTPAKLCMYDAGIVLEDDIEEDDIVSIQTIPSGHFAVIDIACDIYQISHVWAWMLNQWLLKTNYRADTKPCYIFYPEKGRTYFETQSGIQLCSPVKLI